MDVYIVSAPEDAPRVREIAEALGRDGLRCVWDRALSPGETYEAVTARRLAEARAILIAWSPRLLASRGLQAEAERARVTGKAISTPIDVVEVPASFADLPARDLAAWPAQSARQSLERLAAALKGETAAAPGSGRPRPRFARRPKFWILSFAVALILSAILYISPEGQAGRGFGIAGRANSLLASVLYAFAFTAFARAMLHLSGRLVGKESPAYFSREFLIFGGVLTLFAVWLGLSGTAPQALAEPRSSFPYGFASAMVVLAPLAALGVLMFRVMRRLMFPLR